MRGVLSTARLLRTSASVFETTIGDASNISFTLTPGFGTQSCVVEVSVAATGEVVAPKITKNFNSGTQVKIDFDTGDIPSSDQFRVVIIGR